MRRATVDIVYRWPTPVGPRLPSARVGCPWLACLLVWMVAARMVLGSTVQFSWWLWCGVGTFLLVVAVLVSLPLGVSCRRRHVHRSGAAGLAATLLLLLLSKGPGAFAAFTFLGGSAVARATVVVYGLGTTRSLDVE